MTNQINTAAGGLQTSAGDAADRTVYIVSATRTPMGSFGGVLKDVPATDLGSIVIKAAIEKAGLQAADIQEVFMGQVLQAGSGQAPARQAALKAGLPSQVVCSTINKVCASGMKAVMLAAQAIRAGDLDIAVAGGMENMSQVPFYLKSHRWGFKYGTDQLLDGLAHDGLTDAYSGQAMGMAAELCAAECQISREMQDSFAIQSYKRSQLAWQSGAFIPEITPVFIPAKKGEPVEVNKDEEPFKVIFDKISQLKPAFKKDGTVTPANASTMNDGAAALVLMSKREADKRAIKPLAIIRSYADQAQAPEWFTTSPALAVPVAVQKAGLQLSDIQYFELNEAFSVVGIANTEKLGISSEQVNVNGGAVSLGHPLGCSGARILVTLIGVLQQQKARYGAAGICNGGGGASAMVIERPDA
jgi:acetyl-CoA C-acetyltransferase